MAGEAATPESEAVARALNETPGATAAQLAERAGVTVAAVEAALRPYLDRGELVPTGAGGYVWR